MRLIDADKLINALNLCGCYKYRNPKAYDTLMLYEILGAIEDQLTAFDMDKVVEELKNEAWVIGDYSNELHYCVDLLDVLEIVKRGGADDK